jgi:hypothetical protein
MPDGNMCQDAVFELFSLTVYEHDAAWAQSQLANQKMSMDCSEVVQESSKVVSDESWSRVVLLRHK